MTTAAGLNRPTPQPAAPVGRRLRLPVLLLIIAGALALTSLNLRGGSSDVHALPLRAAILLVIGAIWLVVTKKYAAAVPTLAVGLLVLTCYALTDEVLNQVVSATPYVITLLVLALSAQRLLMPRADGMPYRKGQGK